MQCITCTVYVMYSVYHTTMYSLYMYTRYTVHVGNEAVCGNAQPGLGLKLNVQNSEYFATDNPPTTRFLMEVANKLDLFQSS